MDAQLRALEISATVDGSTIFDPLSLDLSPGDRVGLIGPNGAGKTTLLSVLAGRLAPATGSVELAPNDAIVALLDQEQAPQAAHAESGESESGETIGEFLARRTGVAAAQVAFDEAIAELADPDPTQADAAADRYDRALARWLRLDVSSFEASAARVLDDLGLAAETWLDRSIASCSGGERARVGLAAVELVTADILLLDEPTNDLDVAGLSRLEQLVLADQRPRIIVSHDRRFLANVVNRVIELNPWEQRLDSYSGSWDDYQREREVAAAHAQQRHANYVGERDRLTQRARTERSWSDQGVTKAKKHADPDKIARNWATETSENLAAKAKRTERALERLEVVDKPWEPWQLQFTIGESARSGDLVASLDAAVVERGDFRLGPISLEVFSGDRIRIHGANGAGKTTLIRALLGEIPLASGGQRMGASVVVGQLDQRRLRIDPATSVFDALVEETALIRSEARSLLASFGLGADHVDRPIGTLSPGERTRMLLAVFQGSGVNTLVLDEPTNHLDLPAVEQLEVALGKFAGTLLMVTHDRAFASAVEVSRTVEL